MSFASTGPSEERFAERCFYKGIYNLILFAELFDTEGRPNSIIRQMVVSELTMRRLLDQRLSESNTYILIRQDQFFSQDNQPSGFWRRLIS